MAKDYSCETCMYANPGNGKLVMCDRRLLTEGVEVYIDASKVNSCICHSDKPVEETRYMRPNKDMREAEDACQICGRLYNNLDSSNYDVVEFVSENNQTIDVRVCRICIEKGRGYEDRYDRI